MSNTWHVYTITGTEGKVIVGSMATAIVRGDELTGGVTEIVPSFEILTAEQTRAINTYGFVSII